MNKDMLLEAAAICSALARDRLIDGGVVSEHLDFAADILSLLASGEWVMVPRKMPPAMYAGGNISDLDWAALIAAAPDPLAETPCRALTCAA